MLYKCNTSNLPVFWAEYWWSILYFNHSIHKWFKNVVNHIALPSIWSFTLLYAAKWNMGQQCSLVGSCSWAVSHSPEPHYDLGCREAHRMATLAHFSGFWYNHFEQVSDIGDTWVFSEVSTYLENILPTLNKELFPTWVWMCLCSDSSFNWCSKFG